MLLVLAFVSVLSVTIPVSADGGPLVTYDLWAQLKEGQQIAVVTLRNDNTAKIDLFISILDKTQQSHDINKVLLCQYSSLGILYCLHNFSIDILIILS